jgi:two-component sensor histidine kinase
MKRLQQRLRTEPEPGDSMALIHEKLYKGDELENLDVAPVHPRTVLVSSVA